MRPGMSRRSWLCVGIFEPVLRHSSVREDRADMGRAAQFPVLLSEVFSEGLAACFGLQGLAGFGRDPHRTKGFDPGKDARGDIDSLVRGQVSHGILQTTEQPLR